MKDCVRHGDLLFRSTTERPADLRPRTGTVIERGEVTGHAHRISEGDAAILERYETTWRSDAERLTARFLDVRTAATVTHEEHGPVTLAPGLYEVLQAREFDYAANLGRRVRD